MVFSNTFGISGDTRMPASGTKSLDPNVRSPKRDCPPWRRNRCLSEAMLKGAAKPPCGTATCPCVSCAAAKCNRRSCRR